MQEKETIIEKLGGLLGKLGTVVMMNLVFLAACIPVVTMGQAWCGLLSAIRYQIRGDAWWDGFKFGFKTRFLRGTIAWCIMLALDAWMFTDLLQYTSAEVSLVYPITSGIMFALMVMLTTAVMTLNVYIPTDISTWIKNATSMIFKVPLQLLVAAAAIWAPVVLFFFRFDIFYYIIMIFVVAYFTLVGFAATILLKGHLMELLLEARSEGTLLAEEGRVIEKEEENEEESE
ncbi:MAG: DUF624 domain-containing protein [Oscillospiraceae bacterium]|nr:DUF624 domain-containing protein [Oscillospiraceae bacterium]